MPRLNALSFDVEVGFGHARLSHPDGEGPGRDPLEQRAKPECSRYCPPGPRPTGKVRRGPHPTLGAFLPGKGRRRKLARWPALLPIWEDL